MEQIENRINKPVTLIDIEGNEVKEYNIPDDVTSIGNSAFENCSELYTKFSYYNWFKGLLWLQRNYSNEHTQ
jgi:hypothetical protein